MISDTNALINDGWWLKWSGTSPDYDYLSRKAAAINAGGDSAAIFVKTDAGYAVMVKRT